MYLRHFRTKCVSIHWLVFKCIEMHSASKLNSFRFIYQVHQEQGYWLEVTRHMGFGVLGEPQTHISGPISIGAKEYLGYNISTVHNRNMKKELVVLLCCNDLGHFLLYESMSISQIIESVKVF